MLATGVARHRVVVAGGGVGGLALALALGRAGHDVTVVERDPLPVTTDAEPDGAEIAFAADRRGAPQVHQTHGFLARVLVELRRHFPDVLDELLAAGGTTMPTTAALGDPRPGDEDLKVLIIRRTTLEWVLRRAAAARSGVRFVTGETVVGLVTGPLPGPSGTAADAATDAAAGDAWAHERRVPVVEGVVLGNGVTLAADVVVAATGRRGDVPGWLGAIGVDVPEVVHESGLMYMTRWYRLPEGRERELDPKLGGDLGFVKYLAVPGDAGTLSITLALRPDGRDGRHRARPGDGGGLRGRRHRPRDRTGHRPAVEPDLAARVAGHRSRPGRPHRRGDPDPDAYPVPEAEGPDRDGLLAHLAGLAGDAPASGDAPGDAPDPDEPDPDEPDDDLKERSLV